MFFFFHFSIKMAPDRARDSKQNTKKLLLCLLYWKKTETHILTFQTSDLLYEQILSLYQQFIPADTDDYFSTNFFNFCWWRIPLAITSLPPIGVHRLYTRRKPELENKSLLKKMDRWIIFRLKIVSLFTNNDKSWSTFPICNRFLWNEYKILFLRLND